MAGLKGKSGPPGNMNAFKHGLAAIQKRREENISPSTRRTSTHRLGWIPTLQMADGFDLQVHIWRETNGTVCVNRSYGARTFSK